MDQLVRLKRSHVSLQCLSEMMSWKWKRLRCCHLSLSFDVLMSTSLIQNGSATRAVMKPETLKVQVPATFSSNVLTAHLQELKLSGKWRDMLQKKQRRGLFWLGFLSHSFFEGASESAS